MDQQRLSFLSLMSIENDIVQTLTVACRENSERGDVPRYPRQRVIVVHSPANSTKHYLQKAWLSADSLRTPLNHGAEQASDETLKQTQQRN